MFLVVDGWSTLRADFDDLEIELQQLATRGLTFGLHLVVGAARWADFRAAMRDLFGTRLELRLGDPMDSEIDRKVAALVPAGRPGRGLVQGKLHFLTALPRIDGAPDSEGLGDGVEDLVKRVAAAWTGPTGPKLRLLPERISLDEVRSLAPEAERRLLLGIDERDLAAGRARRRRRAAPAGVRRRAVRQERRAARLRPRGDAHPHAEGGAARGRRLPPLAARRGPGGVPAQLPDLGRPRPRRRSATSRRTSSRGIPGPDVTPEQLRNRSWWTGAEVFVLVDDYDLVATQQSSPVAALQPLLAQARDVGLHLVVARRSGGASRALYEPVIQSLRDLAMPGLLLSGSPDEGPLLGNQKPPPAPPGRGRLITRDRGVEVVQMAWREPTL